LDREEGLMNGIPGWRPSPAIVIASLALVVALSGTSYAAFVLPANSVGTKQLKKSAVTAAKIRNNSITSAKVKNDSLGGSDVLEAGLSKVRSAGRADTATTAQHSANADHATSADNATSANHATSAGNAGNASYANFAGFAQGANELNGFNAAELAPEAVGQHDTSAAGVPVTGGGQTEIDSVPIFTARDGILVISGSVFLNNNTAAETLFDLVPKVDGATIGDGTKATTKLAADTGGTAVGEVGSLAYTAVAFVKAGQHTVAQTAGPQTGSGDFEYNMNDLSLIWAPFGAAIETTEAIRPTRHG
jgi:hypothetical protein